MFFSEEQFKKFSAPLSKTEDEKCKNAIREVRDALRQLGFVENRQGITRMIEDSSAYQIRMQNDGTGERVTIFLQGSYANNTNIKAESDVDVAVVREDRFNTLYRITQPSPQSNSTFGIVDLDPESPSFKDRVQRCLEDSFPGQVKRHNKSIKVSGNTYRKDADTVPAYRYRNYTSNYSDSADDYIGGIKINPDRGDAIVNYPEQHISEGRKKNVATKHSYKRQVRIMKSVCKEMAEVGYLSAQQMSSFGLESLTWNIPDEVFNRYTTLKFIFDEVVKYLVAHSQSFENYKEANGIKTLCKNNEELQNVKQFVIDLSAFFEYTV